MAVLCEERGFAGGEPDFEAHLATIAMASNVDFLIGHGQFLGWVHQGLLSIGRHQPDVHRERECRVQKNTDQAPKGQRSEPGLALAEAVGAEAPGAGDYVSDARSVLVTWVPVVFFGAEPYGVSFPCMPPKFACMAAL